MNREWVLFHLGEAQGELAATIQAIREDPEYDYGEFLVAVQHLYYHLNTAWNSRDATADQVAGQSDEDFNRWSQFPMVRRQCCLTSR